MPYVTLKSAQTLDGRTADSVGFSKWITSPEAREHAHDQRGAFSAILAGIGTVLEDDPFLLKERSRRSDLLRVVVDSRARLPITSNIVKSRDLAPVLLATTENADTGKLRELRDLGIEVVLLPDQHEKVCLNSLLKELAQREIVSVLVEGGSRLTGSFLAAGLADEVMIYIAPKIMGGGLGAFEIGLNRRIEEMLRLKIIEKSMIGPDIFLRSTLEREDG